MSQSDCRAKMSYFGWLRKCGATNRLSNSVAVRLKEDKAPAFTEARRYFLNAEDLLRKAGRHNGNFKDKKYVRLTGHAAWHAVLMAVDEYLKQKDIVKRKRRPTKDWYSDQLARLNKKLSTAFNNAYEGLHLHLGYDGGQVVQAARLFLHQGKQVIELCRKG